MRRVWPAKAALAVLWWCVALVPMGDADVKVLLVDIKAGQELRVQEMVIPGELVPSSEVQVGYSLNT